MIVRNENQALCVAVEMERRAIGIYERALLLAQDEGVRKGIRDILSDEQEHLRRFTAMRADCGLEKTEERMLLKALAAEVLFPGGVMEMEREQGLSSCLILQVHDELLIETKKEELDQVKQILEEEMHHAADLAVDLEVDTHEGETWYDAK